MKNRLSGSDSKKINIKKTATRTLSLSLIITLRYVIARKVLPTNYPEEPPGPKDISSLIVVMINHKSVDIR